MYDQDNTIFALDIGTRTVMGLVVTDEETPEVLTATMVEHSSRAMEDGQVHDVEAVAKVVAQIKEELSEKVGFPLNSAAIAAAGRSLLTTTTEVTKEIRAWGEISREDVNALELETVQKAQREIRAQSPRGTVNTRYHCVGYSVNEYLLDGSPIKSLVGHRGSEATCRLTATFLPEIVVDALYAVLKNAGLEVRSMTLEPIAAAGVVIPRDLRLLNLALVDMGAGTSDIAISKGGMITAYGMVPLAGDEVSEVLEENFILDFATAEQVKRQLAAVSELSFRNVLGQQYDLPSSEVFQVIKPTIQEIAGKIGAEILRLNGGVSPKAVICIGGASQTPKIRDFLAEALSLPVNRVAIKEGKDTAENIRGDLSVLAGPDGVTPLGIALSARNRSVLSFQSVEVKVDGTPVRLFNLISPSVADALIAADVDPAITRNRLGLALTAKVNGTFQVVKGTPGKPGAFLLNGEPASLDSPVADGDELEVIPAIHGQDAKARVADLIPQLKEIRVIFNGKEVVLRPQIYLNGKEVGLEEEVPDGADIVYSENMTLRDLLRCQGTRWKAGGDLVVTVNRRTRQVRRATYTLKVDGIKRDLDFKLHGGERVEFSQREEVLTIKDLLTEKEREELEQSVGGISVLINGERVELPGSGAKILRNGKPVSLEAEVYDGDDIQVIPGRKEAHYFAEVFNYIPLDPGERPEGATLVTLLNGQPAEYSTAIKDGDELVIRWEKNN